MKKRHRPNKRRHWSLADIDSDLWWKQARRLKVQRRVVEASFWTPDRASIDPHDLSPDGSPAERVAAYFLLFEHVPTYACLMYVSHAWHHAGRSLKEWIVSQYACLLDRGEDEQRKSILYSLWVDFFEVPERAKFVFPRILRLVREKGELIASSGPVPWALKRDAYFAAADDPALHGALARGLAGSFFDVYGSVDALEARRLFHAITVEDEEVRTALERILTRPISWRVLAVLSVDERDQRWRKWVSGDEPSYLMLLEAEDESRWVHGSDLLLRGRPIGRLVHYAFPFDPSIPHRIFGEFQTPGLSKIVLFRVEGQPARDAVGERVEAWPAGLAPRP